MGQRSAGRRERNATRIVFFVAGLATAAWAPLVPFAKARTGLDEAALGLLLLCLGGGSIASMSLAGALAARLGCRLVLLVSAVPLCLTLPLLATIASPVPLAATLLLFGAGLGGLEVAMNVQAVIVERDSGRSMMSGFHGLFSLGGMTGAAGLTALLGAGSSPLAATCWVVAVIAVALVPAVPSLLPYAGHPEAPVFALPRGIVLFIGGLCFVAFLAEGAVLDWSAIFLSAVRGMDRGYAGLGYAAFSLAMTAGRLTGDRVVQRLRGPTVIKLGGCCAAVGFATATLLPFWQTALIGYALVGAGCANVVPVLYTSVGRQTVVPEHVAVSAISTMGYAGILAGPAVIGVVAHASSLPAAFMMLAVLQVGLAFGGRWLRA